MFADELDADMFSDAPMTASAVAPEKKSLLDNYDDAEGYYNFQVIHDLMLVMLSHGPCMYGIDGMHSFLTVEKWPVVYCSTVTYLVPACTGQYLAAAKECALVAAHVNCCYTFKRHIKRA